MIEFCANNCFKIKKKGEDNKNICKLSIFFSLLHFIFLTLSIQDYIN